MSGVECIEEGMWAVPSLTETLADGVTPVSRVVTATGDARGLLRFACDCPGNFGRPGKPCRHIRLVVETLRAAS